MKLSYSKISDFLMCPKKYWFTYIKEVPIVDNIYLKAGKEIHDMLFQSTRHKEWESFLTTHPKYAEYKLMVDNYIKFQRRMVKMGFSPKPFLAEAKAYDSNLDFSFIMDRVDEKEGDLLLIDYKSDKKKETPDKHMMQLMIYATLYNLNTNGKRITHIAPLYLKLNNRVWTREVTNKRMIEALEWIKKYKADIEHRDKDEKNYPCKTSFLCNYCSHKMTGYCTGYSEREEVEML